MNYETSKKSGRVRSLKGRGIKLKDAKRCHRKIPKSEGVKGKTDLLAADIPIKRGERTTQKQYKF